MTNSTPDAPSAPTPPSSGPAPYTNNTNVKDGDLKILTVVAFVAMLVLILFGVSLYASGLLSFPAISQDSADRDYYNDTLVYRERRMAIALLMRTFLTGFSFVVGLALCTMGGLFILRQVTSLTSLSGNIGGGGLGAQMIGASEASPKEAADHLKKTQFSFASYSPGVLFMVGGVVIMSVTQLLAIPIRGVEIVPPGTSALCQDPATGNFVTCSNSMLSSAPQDTQAAGLAATGVGPVVTSAAPSLDGDSFATSEAVVVPVSDGPEEFFVTDTDLDLLTLEDGFSLRGITTSGVSVTTPAGDFIEFLPSELDFSQPDWGIAAALQP